MENKVCLIVPYFGRFPNYFNFWLRSCEYNRMFDWIIFTDNNLIIKAPNIKVFHYTWEEICEYIQSKFNFEIALNQPYKLCDFRPAYGYIFQEFIKEYHFWGYCDVDVIWGNLRKFITDDILNKYDRIYRNGHFCLYRNIEATNKLFQKNEGIKYDYKYVFTHASNFAFDENGIPIRSRVKELLPFIKKELDPFNSLSTLGGCNTLAIKYNIKQYENIDFDDIRQNQYSLFSTRKVANYTLQQSQKMPTIFTFFNGSLERTVWTPNGINVSESMYIHLQKRCMNIMTNDMDKFCITPNCFVDYTTDVSKYRKKCSNKIYWSYWKKRIQKLSAKIKIGRSIKIPFNIITMLLPWCLRRYVYNNIYGYKIDKTARIGFSYVFPKMLIMKEKSQIRNFSIIINCDKVEIGENSHIGRQCWVTGYPSEKVPKHFMHQLYRRSELIIGHNTAITKSHYFDCTNTIKIGNYCTIGGYSSRFLTHSVNIYKNRQDSNPITIGDYCFISTDCIILGGSSIPSYCLLAAGAVANKQYNDTWKIYAGVPAKPIKDIPKDSKYFCRTTKNVE